MTQTQTAQERQVAYRQRLTVASKEIVRIILPCDVAAELRRLAHNDMSRTGDVVVKALAALERVENGAEPTP